MASELSRTAAFARRLTAALLVLVLITVSIASSLVASPAVAATTASAVSLSAAHGSVPKPCHKAVLPGAINTCPLAAFGVNGLPTHDSGTVALPPAVHSLRWQIAHLRRAAQCGAASPYRPPRRLS